ncbi:MAG: hypothetical protein KDJ52_34185 [Anaerolineae bacterium]|nr:hypothetical protein [Anaerolineae bacterium]
MLRGDISAGNAQVLTDALEQGDYSSIRRILQSFLQETQEKGAESCLLSNELLVLALAQPGRLQNLISIADEAGVASCKFLLFLRDPIDQALSLYKHRAKIGTAVDIEVWPEQYYFYGEGLQRFFQAVREFPTLLACRKYENRVGFLEEVFFRDWLKISSSLKPPIKVVNPSLSISELLLIKQLRSMHDQLPEVLYKSFLAIPKEKKAQEPRIEQYYRDVLASHLEQYRNTWTTCNNYLPPDEQLELPMATEQSISSTDKVMTFSPVQGQLIARLIQNATTSSFRWALRKKQWLNKLSKLKRQMVKS